MSVKQRCLPMVDLAVALYYCVSCLLMSFC